MVRRGTRAAHARETPALTDTCGDETLVCVGVFTEKKRLQLRDVDRERDRNKQLDAAERAHTTGVTMLERLYERKLALESAKSEKQRKEFQQLNMKLSVELERTRQTFAKEMSEIRTLYESEKESHTFDSASLGAKLKTVEAEALVLLEEQDLDHDQDMVHDKSKRSNVQR